MKTQNSKLKTQNSNPLSLLYEFITPPTPSYLKRGCQRRGRYFKGGMGGVSGFTLIELVITMVLIGIVAYVVASALSTGIKAYFVTDFRKEAIDQARIAMERMTREIRNVRSLGRSIDADGFIDAEITTATATSFCFTDVNGTIISFAFSGTNILRGEGSCPPASTNTLASNVTALNFQYILADGSTNSAPPDPTDIRRVQITLTSTISGESVTLQSEVWPRNL